MLEILDSDTIAVWFSCGAASAVAAKRTVDLYGKRCRVRVLNNPVAEEDEDNLRFLKDVEQWIGVPIETVASKKYPTNSAVDVWNDKKYMSGVNGAPCTTELKKRARQEWEADNKVQWHVLGFTFDEQRRHSLFVFTERSNVIPVLINNKLTKDDCFEIIKANGIKLPRVYEQGYANANCIGCVKVESPTYWNHVRRTHPDVFNARAEQARRLGAKLATYRRKRLYLDELPPDAKGYAMKKVNMECGIFCEEATEPE